MGTKLCFDAPTDAGEQPTYSYDSDSETETDRQFSGPFGKLSMESKMNSTDFTCDPTESFRRNISNICNRKRLPALNQLHRYHFYIWSSNKYGFGHDSIVIAPTNSNNTDDNFGYITAELCVDIDDKTVFPHSRYLSQYEGKEYLKSHKWKYQYSYTTTLDSIIQFILNLIAHHGQYSNVHNGCHHFIDAFLRKIIISEREYRIDKQLKNNKLYQQSTNEYIRGYLRYRACNLVAKQLKKERMRCSYDTMEAYLQFAGTLLVLPVIAMAISKESVKTQRDKVHFKRIDHD